MTHRRFLHPPLEGSLGHNYTEHQLQCMLRHLNASSEIHCPEFDKPCQFITKKTAFPMIFLKKWKEQQKWERIFTLNLCTYSSIVSVCNIQSYSWNPLTLQGLTVGEAEEASVTGVVAVAGVIVGSGVTGSSLLSGSWVHVTEKEISSTAVCDAWASPFPTYWKTIWK